NDLPADDSGIAAEVTPPQRIAQDDDAIVAGQVLVRLKKPAISRPNSQQCEERCLNARGEDALRFAAAVDLKISRVIKGHAFKTAARAAHIEQLRNSWRDARHAIGPESIDDSNEAVRFGKR